MRYIRIVKLTIIWATGWFLKLIISTVNN